MTIDAGILIAVARDELLQIHRSVWQVLDMKRHILDETGRTDWALAAHGWEDAGADRPVLSVDLRIIGEDGLAIEVKPRERVHDLLDICLQAFRRQGLGLGEDSREIVIVAFGYAADTACIHIVLIVEKDGVVDTLQRQIVEHLRTLYLEILIGHRHVVLLGFQLFQSHDSLAALFHGLEINHRRSAIRIFVQRSHANMREEGKRTFRAHDTVSDDVEGIVVVDKWTDVETRDVLDRILIPDALREVCILPDLITQGLDLLEKVGMTLAKCLTALLISGVENGTIGKDEADAKQHVVAVGMHATVHARGIVDHNTADHSTAHRGRIRRKHTSVRLQDIIHASSRDTGLKGDGVLVFIQAELLPAFARHDEHGVGTTLSGERSAGRAEGKRNSVFSARLESSLHFLLVLCADDDLRGHAVEAGVCSPSISAKTVGIYLSFRNGLLDLGEKLLLNMWIDHNNVTCLLLQR